MEESRQKPLKKIRNLGLLKKVIAIFLLLQIISNNAFAEEMIKLPKLYTHFYHHAREHKDAGDFMDFLHSHYSDHQHKAAHKNGHIEDDDCNLPFKHCGNCSVNTHAPVLGFAVSYFSTSYTQNQPTTSVFISEDDRIESQELCSIWQPPKINK